MDDAIEHGEGATTYVYDGGPRVENGRLAVWLFLCAEALFFGGLISSWFVLRSQDPAWTDGEAPSLAIGGVMTLFLLGASAMGRGAVLAAKDSRHSALAARLGLAGLLAFSFLCLQAIEYGHLVEDGLVPSTSVRWAVFYAMTLCHGLHVAIGVIWVAYLLVQAVGPGLEGDKRGPLEYGVLYLHFVDMVWLLLLVLLYVIR